MDLSALKTKIAATLAKELGTSLPDGVVEKVAGEIISTIGEVLVETGKILSANTASGT